MSEIKVNKISPRTNCGTVQLGDSGDTITIPAGATITNNGTQTGFGRTGTVNWQTTVKTAGFTAANGEGYFVNTTSGGITVNLPAGSAGDIVAFKDYANTWDSNAVTVVPNGTDKIGGENANATLNTESQSVTLIFIDSTKGWLDIHDSTSDVTGAKYITATGGTITTVCTNFKVHTFTGPGTFTVTCGGNAAGSNTVDYLVVAGGGGGGSEHGGAGGAGGYRESPGTASGCYSVSPLGTSPAAALPVSAQGYPITVGGGGAGSTSPGFPGTPGTNGVNSVFSTITSTAGGAGAGGNTNPPGSPGGSAGGGQGNAPTRLGGNGNTPPVDPPQGNNGGNGYPDNSGGGGGGGGATAVGGNGNPSPGVGAGPGGAGATSSINGTPTGRAGGGGGGGQGTVPGGSASSGGGAGANGDGSGTAGTANTGGGGGGGGANYGSGATGGSGIVIIRYKFQ